MGALAYLGCRSGRSGRHQRMVTDTPDLPLDPQAVCHPGSFESDIARLNMYEDPVRQQYLAALNPKETRVIPPNVTPDQWPYYVSEAKHASDSDFGKARKLEMFTGDSNSTTRGLTGTREAPCRAGQAPLFGMSTNAHRVNSEGKTTTLMPLDDERQRYHASDKHNNVGVCEKVMVGPGLGLGPDAQSAGSYHQGYRILPTNRMNFERLNREQPGRVISGRSTVLRPGSFAPFGPQKRPRLGDMTDRPLVTQRADYTAGAPTGRPTRCAKDSTLEAFFGAPAGPQVPGMQGSSTRCRSDAGPNLPVINPISLYANESGYLNAPKGEPRPTRERPGQVLNAYVGGAPGHVIQGYDVPHTNRESYEQTRAPTASNPHVAAPPVAGDWRGPATNRQQAYDDPSPYLGPATGPTAMAPGSQVNIRSMKESLLHDSTPGRQSDNAYNPDLHNFRLRDEYNTSRAPVDERSQAGAYAAPGQATKCRVRTTELNPWTDSAGQQVMENHRRQLASNPLWQPQG